jgi:hypothetical protein
MSLIRINPHPSRRQLRVFAIASLVVTGLLGFTGWRHGRDTTAIICWVLGLGVMAVGLGWPARLRLLYLGLCYATYPIGFVVSWLVLVVIYYGVMTPLGLVMRLFGYDPLKLKSEPAATTYWQKRPGPRSPASYFRQY